MSRSKERRLTEKEKAIVEKYAWIPHVMAGRRPWQIKERDEAVSIGSIGLMKGVTKLKKSFGNAQITNFLKQAAYQEMVHSIHKLSLIKTSSHKKYRDKIKFKEIDTSSFRNVDVISDRSDIDEFIDDEYRIVEYSKINLLINYFVSRLKPIHKELFDLRAVKELSWDEIHSITNKTPDLAQRMYLHVIEKLRDSMKELGELNGIPILQNYIRKAETGVPSKDKKRGKVNLQANGGQVS